MSWSGDTENNVRFSMGATELWKTQMSKIEQTFNKIAQMIDGTKRRFEVMKTRHSEFRSLEKEIETLNNYIRQLSEEISTLEKLTSNNQELNSRRFMIKELRKRAADQTKMVRELCTGINAELQDRELRRKKEISITSHELDFDESNMRHSEQMTIDDSQIKIAIEEQRQIEKITREVIQLEDMFLKLNTMVVEQGEIVDRIEMNVEDAYEKVELGEQELGKAVGFKRSALKKKICIIGIVVAVLLVIALIIGLSVGLKH